MKFDTIRQFLSYAADNLGFQILETKEFRKDVNRALDLTGKWHQRECPLKSPLMMWFVLALMLYRSLSIANVLRKFLHQYREEFPRLPLNAITPEATCHARSRLGVEPLRILFETQAARIKPIRLFHKLRVLAVDGTSFSVPDTPANEGHFGRPKAARGETAFPQISAVCLTETSTRQVGAVVFTPYGAGERKSVLSMLDRLDKSDLLLMDRGISAGWLFSECMERKLHFLGRISAAWKPQVMKRLGAGDSLVSVRGNIPKEYRSGRKNAVKLELRMIEYRIAGNETVRLLTDLLDFEEYPALELAKLYHSRWECELAFDELKNHLAPAALLFRSKSPDGILQEGYALFALYNMIRKLMAKAGELHNLNPLEISFVETIQVIKETTPRFQAATTDRQRSQVVRQMLRDVADCRNLRPRRKRQWPRVVKRKMSNFKLKRKDCTEKQLDFEKELRLVR